MATGGVQWNKLEADVTCPVCLEVFDDPYELPCRHTLCLHCAQGLINNDVITCPKCRKTSDKDGLVKDFKMVGFVQWFKEESKKHANDAKDVPEQASAGPGRCTEKTRELNVIQCVLCEGPGLHICTQCHDIVCDKCIDIHKEITECESEIFENIEEKTKSILNELDQELEELRIQKKELTENLEQSLEEYSESKKQGLARLQTTKEDLSNAMLTALEKHFHQQEVSLNHFASSQVKKKKAIYATLTAEIQTCEDATMQHKKTEISTLLVLELSGVTEASKKVKDKIGNIEWTDCPAQFRTVPVDCEMFSLQVPELITEMDWLETFKVQRLKVQKTLPTSSCTRSLLKWDGKLCCFKDSTTMDVRCEETGKLLKTFYHNCPGIKGTEVSPDRELFTSCGQYGLWKTVLKKEICLQKELKFERVSAAYVHTSHVIGNGLLCLVDKTKTKDHVIYTYRTILTWFETRQPLAKSGETETRIRDFCKDGSLSSVLYNDHIYVACSDRVFCLNYNGNILMQYQCPNTDMFRHENLELIKCEKSTKCQVLMRANSSTYFWILELNTRTWTKVMYPFYSDSSLGSGPGQPITSITAFIALPNEKFVCVGEDKESGGGRLHFCEYDIRST